MLNAFAGLYTSFAIRRLVLSSGVSFCFWPLCYVSFFDLRILVTFKLCFPVYTYSRYHSEIKVYTMMNNLLTVHLRLILDQQAKLGFHSAISLKLQPVDRHCTPLWCGGSWIRVQVR
jgi:hypothetical protein